MNQSQDQLDYLVDYAPDIVAALTNLGQIGGYYDANGHYARTQPFFAAFGLDGVQPADEQAALAARRRHRRGADPLSGRGRAAVARRLVAGERPGLQSLEHAGGTMRRLALIAISLLVAVGAVVAVAGPGSSRGAGSPYLVRAIFDNAAFAVNGEDVRIAGADVGSIQSLDVTPDRRHAAVRSSIDDARFTPFYANATCSIRPQSLIGERYVDCDPGRSSLPQLPQIKRGPGAGSHYLPVTRTTLAGGLRHRPGHLSAADRAALLADPQRARHRPRGPRLRPQRHHPSRQPGARLHRPGAEDPGAPEPPARPARDRLRQGARAAGEGQDARSPGSSRTRTRHRSPARPAPRTSRARSSCSRSSCASCGR